MKAIILAGGKGTRISEESLISITNGRDREQTYFMAFT